MPKSVKHAECTLWFCHEPHYGRGLCARHYQNWLRNGDPLPAQSDDLRVVLLSVLSLQSLLRRVVVNDCTFSTTEINGRVIATRCNYCGNAKEGGDVFEIENHASNCIIPAILGALVETTSTPPENDLTYEVKLERSQTQTTTAETINHE